MNLLADVWKLLVVLFLFLFSYLASRSQTVGSSPLKQTHSDFNKGIVHAIYVCQAPGQRSVVRALSCYQCNSFKNADCMEVDKLAQFKAPCPPGAVGCRKIFYKLDLGHHGVLVDRMVRQCSKTQGDKVCYTVFGTNGKRYKQYTCECDHDNCNPSTRSKPQIFLTCAIAVVTMVMLV